MYLLEWILLLALSVWFAFIAFMWALQSGQFANQSRARYLPMANDTMAPPVKDPGKVPKQFYALLAILLMGISVMAAAVAVGIHNSR